MVGKGLKMATAFFKITINIKVESTQSKIGFELDLVADFHFSFSLKLSWILGKFGGNVRERK